MNELKESVFSVGCTYLHRTDIFLLCYPNLLCWDFLFPRSLNLNHHFWYTSFSLFWPLLLYMFLGCTAILQTMYMIAIYSSFKIPFTSKQHPSLFLLHFHLSSTWCITKINISHFIGFFLLLLFHIFVQMSPFQQGFPGPCFNKLQSPAHSTPPPCFTFP